MKRLLWFGLLCWTAVMANTGISQPVTSFKSAIDKVRYSVQQNKLSDLHNDCLMFIESEETVVSYYIDVFSKQGEQCQAVKKSEQLFTYSVNKAEGFLHTNAIWSEQRGIEDFILYPIDPVSPVYRYNDDNTEYRFKHFRRNDNSEIRN